MRGRRLRTPARYRRRRRRRWFLRRRGRSATRCGSAAAHSRGTPGCGPAGAGGRGARGRGLAPCRELVGCGAAAASLNSLALAVRGVCELACCKTLALTARLLHTRLCARNGVQEGLYGSGMLWNCILAASIFGYLQHNFDLKVSNVRLPCPRRAKDSILSRNALQ